MTFEKTITFGIEDIKAVVLRCNHCTARFTFSPDRVVIREVCPMCDKPWTTMYPKFGDQQFSSSVKLIRAIEAIRTEKPDIKAGFEILLEFDDPRP